MLLNTETVLTWKDRNVALYPYRRQHVERYHTWMSSPEIRSLTASEELSLEEEYAMQASWQVDADKLTFIVTKTAGLVDHNNSVSVVENMIGDVNLFISKDNHEEDEDITDRDGGILTHQDHGTRYSGELELMIAEPTARRKGFGKSALLLFISYILRHREEVVPGGTMSCFTVKIGQNNEPSMKLFESLGFVRYKFAEYFQEWELRMTIDSHTTEIIDRKVSGQGSDWSESRIDW